MDEAKQIERGVPILVEEVRAGVGDTPESRRATRHDDRRWRAAVSASRRASAPPNLLSSCAVEMRRRGCAEWQFIAVVHSLATYAHRATPRRTGANEPPRESTRQLSLTAAESAAVLQQLSLSLFPPVLFARHPYVVRPSFQSTQLPPSIIESTSSVTSSACSRPKAHTHNRTEPPPEKVSERSEGGTGVAAIVGVACARAPNNRA